VYCYLLGMSTKHLQYPVAQKTNMHSISCIQLSSLPLPGIPKISPQNMALRQIIAPENAAKK
jgi:hypothetical protein